MSHSVEYFQRLSDADLAWQVNNATYSYDRNNARRVQEQRAAERRRAQSEASNRLERNITDLTNRINQLNNTNADLQRTINAQNDRMRSMQSETAAAINRVMDENNAAIERANANNARQIAAVRSDLTNQINGARNEFRAGIENLRTQVNEQIAREQLEINKINDTLQKIAQTNVTQVQQARQYYDTAIEVINSTIELNNQNSHSWRNEEIPTLTNLQDNARNDIRNNFGSNAYSSARTLFQTAMEYRAHVIADEQEWQRHSAEAHLALESTMARLETGKFINLDGVKIDVDYWTCGDLRRLGSRLEELSAVVNNPCTGNEELDAACGLCETYVKQMEEAEQYALQAAQISSDRELLMEEAVHVLEDRFGSLHPVWQEYYNGDNRLGRRVVLTSKTDDVVVLTAEPVKDPATGKPVNSFKYDILQYGNSITNRNDADNFMQQIENAVNEVEGVQTDHRHCGNEAKPVYDPQKINKAGWVNPAAEECDRVTKAAAGAAVYNTVVPAKTTFTPQGKLASN